VELAIGEEKARAARRNEPVRNDSEPGGGVPNGSEAGSQKSGEDTEAAARVKLLESQVLDLKILNGGKDFLIEQLRKEREGLMNQATNYSRRIGHMEAELRQLSGPRNSTEEAFPNEREGADKSYDTGNRSGTL
jgi:hypothetical protein